MLIQSDFWLLVPLLKFCADPSGSNGGFMQIARMNVDVYNKGQGGRGAWSGLSGGVVGDPHINWLTNDDMLFWHQLPLSLHPPKWLHLHLCASLKLGGP